jgi:glycosyltransferase involved in cell wall biosynthesis
MEPDRVDRRRLLTLATYSTSPGQRFRIQTWAPYLAKHGIDTTEFAFCTPALERLLPRPGRFPAKIWETARAYARYPFHVPRPGDYDAVLVFREAMPLGPPLWERWIGRSAAVRLVYDIDDPIFIRDVSPTNPVSRVLRDWDKWKTICGAATVTVCINEMIAEHVRPYCRRVEVVPNAIDVERYALKPDGPLNGLPVLGYSGSYSTMRQLRDIRDALERLGRIQPYVLRVVGGAPPFRLASADVENAAWTAEREVELLHGFDVGLAPAPDDEWNRYKSFVKVLLYMAVGLPVVAAPVGLPRRLIRDGENGFLARTPAEWVERLVALLRDPELRCKLGRAARETVAREFDLAMHLPRVLTLFRGVMGDDTGLQ